eukprot:g3671.t1
MEVEKQVLNGSTAESSPLIHLLPELPDSSKKSGGLDSFVELTAADEYLIDGRVKQVQLGFSWTTNQVDVDASLAAFDAEHKCRDVVWWDKKYSHYLSAELMNDDRTGEKPENSSVNETIQINFATIPNAVHYLLAVLTVYSKGKSLRDVSDISMKLSHNQEGTEKDLFVFKTGEFQTAAVIMGMFVRRECWWEFNPIGKASIGRTVKEVIFTVLLGDVSEKKAVIGKSYKIYAWVSEGRDMPASDRPICGKANSDCYVEIKSNCERFESQVAMKRAEIGPTNELIAKQLSSTSGIMIPTSNDDFLECVCMQLGGICQKEFGDMKRYVATRSPNTRLVPKSGLLLRERS